MQEILFKIGVFAVIVDEMNAVLLCHRSDLDVWNLPGGGLDKYETPWEGVVREVLEETTLQVGVSNLIGVYSKKYKNEIVFLFKCYIISGIPQPTEESRMCSFFAPDQIPQSTLKNHVERINDYYNSINDNLILKTQ